jgi:Xaa-Pro dipeptidase
MSVSNSPSVYAFRQARLSAALPASSLDGFAINAGPSLVYLTGLHYHLSERPVIALFRPEGPLVVVVPEMEAGKVQGLPYPAQAFTYPEDPAEWPAAFRRALQAAGLDQARPGGPRIGLEPGRLRVLELRLMEAGAPQAEFIANERVVASLRMYKDESEISAMRKAVAVAQQALDDTLPLIHPGMAERELAAELTLQILRHGSDPEMPFFPIVAAGPNAANPHAVPGDRRLAPGDLLILDWGATSGGYFSDLTRTFAIGQPDPELARIVRITAEANAAAREKAGPGVPAGEVDRAARAVIEAAGYGPAFLHRTGHGLGMEGHEEPYIRAGNDLALEPGMTFTIEPGIYLPGRGGARIEDDFLITPDGGESLSDYPRELMEIGDS